MTNLKWIVLGVALGAGCKTGMSPEMRNEVQAKMMAAQGPLSACYAATLNTPGRRKTRGMMTIEFIAEASTGQFKNVVVRRDEPNDPNVRQCVIAEVTKIKLDKPPTTNLQIAYPIRFTPNE